MEKMKSKLRLTIGVLLLSLGIVFQAQARVVHKDKENVFSLSTESYQTSLRLGAGYLTGTAHEIVNAGSFSENYRSRLTWEIDQLYMAGLGLSFQKDWVIFHADGWLKVAEGEGTMDDYDWMTTGPDWTDWSHHDDTIITEAGIFDMSFEFLIPQLSSNHFLLSAFLGYKYETFKWEARGGTFVYSSEGSFRDQTGTFPASQLGISYEQSYCTPYLGVGLRANFNNFEIAGRLIGSPFVSSEADDIHHLRNFNTTAEMKQGNMVSVDISGTYSFTNQLSLLVSYNYESYEDLKGDATWYEVNQNQEIVSTRYLNAESMDLETSMVSIALIYSF